MIPVLSVIVGMYVIARMLELLADPDVHMALYCWALLTIAVAVIGVVYIIVAAEEAARALEALPF